MEIVDLTEVFRGSEFKVFSGALESAAWCAASKATGEFPRSRFDALTEQAQSLGAKGLAWAVVEDGGWRSPIAKFLVRGRDRAGERRAGGRGGRRAS